MDNEQKQVEQLSTMLDSIDNWLVKFGYITNHAHNRVIKELVINVKNVRTEDIEYLVDQEQRRVEVIIYFSLWYLLWVFITGKRNEILTQVMRTVEDVLSEYEIRASLRRRGRREKDHKLINSKPIDADATGDEQGSELQDSQDILPDQGESSEDQSPVRDEPVERDLESDEETQNPS